METGGRRLACDPGRDPGRDPARVARESPFLACGETSRFLARFDADRSRATLPPSSPETFGDSASSSEVVAEPRESPAAESRCSRGRALPPRDCDDEPERWCAWGPGPCPPRRRPARTPPSPPSPPSLSSRRCRRELGDACASEASERCRRRCSSRRSDAPSAAGGRPGTGTSQGTALARLACVDEYTLAPASAAPSRLPARNTPARTSVPPLSPEPLMFNPDARR